MRRVSRVAVAWERLRARRKLGTAMAASKAMIATTIMISTRVKPERRDWSLVNIFGISGVFECFPRVGSTDPADFGSFLSRLDAKLRLTFLVSAPLSHLPPAVSREPLPRRNSGSYGLVIFNR